VSVLNGGAANGAATRAAAVLKRVGFIATSADSTAPMSTTTIEYPAGMQAQAKTLAQYVPGAIVRSASVAVITLVLAADGVTAKSTPATTTAPSSTATAKPKPVDAGCIN
jgi:hypothetical protein